MGNAPRRPEPRASASLPRPTLGSGARAPFASLPSAGEAQAPAPGRREPAQLAPYPLVTPSSPPTHTPSAYPWPVSRPPPPPPPTPSLSPGPFPSYEPPGPRLAPGADPFVPSASATSGHAALTARDGFRWGLFLVSLVVLAIAAGVAVFLFVPAPRPSVDLSSLPTGALVTVDGVSVGRTPLTLREGLEEGRTYAFRVSLDGYEPANFELRAQPGVDRRQVVLSPTAAVLHLETDPPSAQIEVGGAARGRAPVDIGGLFVGSVVDVRVDAPGFHPRVVRVPISAARHEETIRLEPIR